MNYKIVSDSSANLAVLDGVPFCSVPMHVIVGSQDFTDDTGADPAAMHDALAAYRGKTSTSCPSIENWLAAFGDAEVVYCVTITSNLSGAYNSAAAAAQMYEAEHPGRRVYVFDSLSTGPEMVLILEKIRALVLAGTAPEEVNTQVRSYCRKTHLYFSLASLNNLARNGRINPLIAKGIGLLGIQVIGKASDVGTLQPMHKRRGEKKALACLVEQMKEVGYNCGRVIISHTGNLPAAEELRDLIKQEFGRFNGFIHENRILCGYYAEPKSILVGFEG